MPRTGILAAVAWLGAALLVLGAWLVLPRERVASGPPVRVVLLDVSASALGGDAGTLALGVGSRWDSIRAAAAGRGEELLGIAFGRGARRFDVGLPLARQFDASEDASDLAAAFELAARIADERRVVALELLGDGTFTGLDPAPIAARLARQGVRIEAAPLVWAGAEDDVGIAPIRSPLRVRRGAPVAFEVEAWHARGPGVRSPARVLVLTAELVAGERRERRVERVALSESTQTHELRPMRVAFDLGLLAEDRAELSVRADLEVEGRRRPAILPQNDVARAEVRAADRAFARLLGAPAARAALAARLAPIAPDFAWIQALDPHSLALDSVDVVVSLARDFSAPEAAQIDAHVARGGAWIDLAGEGFAGRARPRSSALVPAEESSGPRAIVVLVDASGSLAGEPGRAARAALSALVETAPFEDALEARWLHDGRVRRLDLGRAGERGDPARRAAWRAAALSGPEPRGPTRIWSALEELAGEVDGVGHTLAILVSDGRDPERADLARRADRLRTSLAGRGARLAVVAVGPDPDSELLAALAGSAELVLDAGELASDGASDRLAQLFAVALAEGSLVAYDPPRRVLVAGLDAPFAAPFAGLVPPGVRRAVRTRAAPGASVVWSVEGGAPLLGFARRGLGVAGTLACSPGTDWLAPEGEVIAAIATAVRVAAPPSAVDPLELYEDAGELVLTGALEDAPAVLRAELFDAAGDGLGVVDLVAARPGRDPRRERSAVLPPELARLPAGASVEARIADPPLALTFQAPRSPEFARLPGIFIPPSVLPGAHAAAPAPHPAGPWTILAGLAAWALALGGGFFSRTRATRR